MNRLIESSFKKSTQLSIKVIRRGKPPKIYMDYTRYIQTLLYELHRDIARDLEACAYDYPNDRVVLSVQSMNGSEELIDLFEYDINTFDNTK